MGLALVIQSNETLTIDEKVNNLLKERNLSETRMFRHYRDALDEIWPQLRQKSPQAANFLAINIYLDAAQAKGFTVHPQCLTCDCSESC